MKGKACSLVTSFPLRWSASYDRNTLFLHTSKKAEGSGGSSEFSERFPLNAAAVEGVSITRNWRDNCINCWTNVHLKCNEA